MLNNHGKEMLIKECPNCGETRCLYGRLEPRDTDYSFDGKFHMPGIKRHTFWSQSDPSVSLLPDEKFHACPDCGHLWARVIKRNFISILEEANWDGAEQFEQFPRPNIFGNMAWAIIVGLLSLIAFLQIDYRYLS
ncbi:MAG: hypothetical protein K6L80_16405 [Agarilytica sp.]